MVLNTTLVDGFRLDAVKHIRAEFYPEWLWEMGKDTEKRLFAVGEYWSSNTVSYTHLRAHEM